MYSRLMVHHTSGIRDYLGLMRIAGLQLGTFHDDQGVVDRKPASVKIPVTELEPYAGRYYSSEVDITVEMSVGEEGIILHHPRKRNEQPEFTPAGGGKFLNLDLGEIQFQFDEGDGAPSSFDLNTGRVKGIRFVRESIGN